MGVRNVRAHGEVRGGGEEVARRERHSMYQYSIFLVVVARRVPIVAVLVRIGEGVGQRVPEQVPVEEHLRMGGCEWGWAGWGGCARGGGLVWGRCVVRRS